MTFKIRTQQADFDVRDESRIEVSSGEADIFQLSHNKLLKKYYYDAERFPMRNDKILAFINKADDIPIDIRNNLIAYPQDVAFDLSNSNEEFCGFSMKYFAGCESMNDVSYYSNKERFKHNEMTDKNAVDIIYELFKLLNTFHKRRIILGDIKPQNILINITTMKPVIVDIDAAQIAQYRCFSLTDEWLDPRVLSEGQDSDGCYNLSINSDLYSMTLVAFQFIVGVSPHSVNLEDPIDKEDAKMQEINYLIFHRHNLTRVNDGSVVIKKNDECLRVFKRLDFLNRNYNALYEFFCTNLVFGKRQSLTKDSYIVYSKKKSSQTYLKNSSRKSGLYRVQKLDTKDPKEFIAFLNNYNISI